MDEHDFGKRALAIRPDLQRVRECASRPIPAATRERIAGEHSARRSGLAGIIVAIVTVSALFGFASGAIVCAYFNKLPPAFDRKADAHLLAELAHCAAGPAWASVYPLRGPAP